MNNKIKPIGSRVLVMRTKTEQKKGNVLLLDSTQKKENTGTVIAIGDLVTELHVGNRVLFDPYTSTPIANEESDDEMLMFKDKDILAVIS